MILAAGSQISHAPRVLVVDDDARRARVLAHALMGLTRQVQRVASGEECLALMPESAPDLVLLDVILPGLSGVEVCRRIKGDTQWREVPVLLMSAARTTSDQQADGLEGGADGYLAWPVGPRELLARVALCLRQGSRRTAPSSAGALTPRQRQVVALVAEGLTNQAIATRLGVTVRTAETHRAASMRRIGAHSTAELVRYAWTHGLVR